jgi:hypothetical protein
LHETADPATLSELMQACQVRLGDCLYPPIDGSGIVCTGAWISSGGQSGEFGQRLSYWRLFPSMQFMHTFAVEENGYPDIRQLACSYWSQAGDDPATGYLEITDAVVRLSEVLMFAGQLAGSGLIRDRIDIQIRLSGMAGSRLFYWDTQKFLDGSYLCLQDDIDLALVESAEDCRRQARSFAIDLALALFERFNWFDARRDFLETDQSRALSVWIS